MHAGESFFCFFFFNSYDKRLEKKKNRVIFYMWDFSENK